VDRWTLLFPAEFWSQLARLEGKTGPPQPLPLSWSPYVLAFVYDAVDAEVRRELRRHDPDPRFANERARWLDAVGPERVADRVRDHLAVMKTCADMDEFDSAFSNVLLKHPLDVRLLPEPT
jgi:P63C domain